MLLGNEALVLRLQPLAPDDGVLESASGFQQQIHRFRVAEALEGFLQSLPEPGLQRLVHKSAEELQLLTALIQHGFHQIAHVFLRQSHVGGQVKKGHLRLDHPKLRRMTRRVAVLRAEGGSEGVDFPQRAGESLPLELAADREVGGPAEKIVLRPGVAAGLERRHPEHLPGALAIIRGDHRRVDMDEAPLLKKTMHRVRHAAAHPEDIAKQVRARPQVRDGAQKLRCVPLFLKRISRVRPAHQAQLPRLHLPALAGRGRVHQGALHLDRGSRQDARQQRGRWQRRVHHHLQGLETRAVGHLQERA